MNDGDDANTGTAVLIKMRARSDRLADEQVMREFLHSAVAAIEARPLGNPIIYNVPIAIRNLGAEPWADEGGITGLVALSVSHIAVHTWPAITAEGKVDALALGEANMLVYSCRPFEIEALRESLKLWYPSQVQFSDLSPCLRWSERSAR